MADLDQRFEQAQADVKALTTRPSNDELLTLYSLFKQATEGEASAAKKPGRFDLVGKAKYDAWSRLGRHARRSGQGTLRRHRRRAARPLTLGLPRQARLAGRSAQSPDARSTLS